MIRQEIWLPNGLGGAFDDQLMKLPQAYEYERRDAVTYHRRTVSSDAKYGSPLRIPTIVPSASEWSANTRKSRGRASFAAIRAS